MGPWRSAAWLGACLVLVVGIARLGWAAEPLPPLPPEPTAETSQASRGAGELAGFTDEERAVVENLEFLEMLEMLEHLEVLRNWDAVANTPPGEPTPAGPTGEEQSYGDLVPKGR